MTYQRLSTLFLLIVLVACRGGTEVATESPTLTESPATLDKLVFEVSYGENQNKSIFLMNADGTGVERKNIAPATWLGETVSPHGDILIGECKAFCECQAQLYNLFTDAKHRLSSPTCSTLQMWSSDSELYVSTNTGTQIISSDGSMIGEFIKKGDKSGSAILSLAPGNSRIAYLTAVQENTDREYTFSIFVADSNFNNANKVLSSVVQLEGPEANIPNVSLGSWNSSGSALAISLVDSSLAADIYITDGEASQLVIDNSDYVWSYPVGWTDEETVLIQNLGSMANPPQNASEIINSFSLFLFNVRTKEKTIVAPQIAPLVEGYGPSLGSMLNPISPDGKRIAFVGLDKNYLHEDYMDYAYALKGLYITDLDTGEAWKVKSIGEAILYAWSPNGETLAILHRIDESDRLYIVDPTNKWIIDPFPFVASNGVANFGNFAWVTGNE